MLGLQLLKDPNWDKVDFRSQVYHSLSLDGGCFVGGFECVKIVKCNK